MKVIITGSPGAGKSRLAKALAKELPEKVEVVDGYVNRLSKRTGFAYGNFASYPQNFQIACERLTKVQEAERVGKATTIVVGSIYETILYTALKVNSDLYFNEAENQATVQMYGSAAMQMLGAFETLTVDHDLLFYLPLDGKALLEKGRSYDTVIDAKLPEVMEGYFRSFTPLEGTHQKKVKDALTATHAYRESQARLLSETNSEAVSGDGKATEAEPVSA